MPPGPPDSREFATVLIRIDEARVIQAHDIRAAHAMFSKQSLGCLHYGELWPTERRLHEGDTAAAVLGWPRSTPTHLDRLDES